MTDLDATRPSAGPRPEGEDLPRRLGEFVLQRVLGRGGMGVVFEAEQPSLGRRVALKVLAPGAMQDPRDRERFAREARAAARLHHTNIVPVFGVSEAEGRQLLAMQLIEGRSAKELVREFRTRRDEAGGDSSGRGIASALVAGEHGPSLVPGLTASADDDSLTSAAGRRPGARYHRSVARLGVQIADALAHAHGRGVLHRDVKPSNVLVDGEERAWLSDFGVAKAEGERDLTHAGDLVGTVRYMAPECFRGRFDARSDVYGLGLTLHELLTLEPAYSEKDEAELLQAVMHRSPPALRQFDASIPRDLEMIVSKACERDAAHRYQSAEAMASDLRAFLDGRPIRARRAGPVERAVRWARRNPVVATLGTSVIALLAVIAVRAQLNASRLEAKNREVTESLARAEAAEVATQSQLYQSSLVQARALRMGGQAGRRAESLEAIATARSLVEALGLSRRSIDDLRDQALASLVLADLVRLEEPEPTERGFGGSWDRAGGRRAFLEADGRLVVLDLATGARLHERTGLGTPDSHSFTRWDATGRWLVARAGEELGRRLVLIDTLDWTESPFTPSGYADDADFSADGRRLLVSTGRNELEVRELATGDVLACLGGSGRRGRARLSPDGALLAYLPRGERAVEIWDVDSGVQVAERVLEQEPELQVTALAWSSDGRRLAAASGPSIRVWDLEAGDAPEHLDGHASSVIALEFASAGALLVSSAWDDTTRAWRIEGGEQVAMLVGHELVAPLDGDDVALVQRSSGRLSAWRASESPVRRVAPGRTGGLPVTVGFLGGGEFHLLGARDGLVSLRETATARLVSEFEQPGLYSATTDGAGRAWLATTDGRILAFRNLRRAATVRLPAPARSLDFAGERLGFGLDGGRSGCFSTEGIAELRWISGVHEGLWSIALSPVADSIASGGWNSAGVRVGHIGDGSEPRLLPGTETLTRAAVAWSPDGRSLLVGSKEAIDVWRAGDWERSTSWPRRSGEGLPARVAVHPTGRVAAISWSAHELRLVTMPEGLNLARLPTSETELLSHVDFSPDGRWLASGDESGALQLWDLEAIERELAGHDLGWPESFW